jgi:serine/threonine-protein kinase
MRTRDVALGLLLLLMGGLIGCSSGDDTTSASSGSAAQAGSSGSAAGSNSLPGSAAGSTATGGSANGGGNTAGQAAGGSNTANARACSPGQPLFHAGSPFSTRIDTAPLDAESDAIIQYLSGNHTADARFQVDFSLTILTADAQTPRRPFIPSEDHYSPDCDLAAPPVPADGMLEGEDGYECTSDGDCHLIVVDSDECRLYEMWRANIVGDEFVGGCLAVWDLSQAYPPEGHGEYCTTADAAGFPIAALTFNADEVAAGAIEHAIRFILPNDLIRSDVYVHPGTHSTSATSGPADAPPYAVRIRLKADADISGLTPAAQVVARALQQYGMLLADGGNITFTAASDRTTQHTWDEVGFGPHDLKDLAWSDFEVVELGQRFEWSSGDCQREPIE